jgi:ankyrin repeat protein
VGEDWWRLGISGKREASRLLLLSTISGNIDLSQHLINIGADVNYPAQGYSCTCLRAKAPVEDRCQLSDVEEADIFHGNTVLMAATRRGNTRMIRMLLEYGSEINAKHPKSNYTPLEMAINEGDMDAMRLLIDWGAEVNETCPERCTSPLVIAAKNGRVEAINALVTAGADVNMPLAGDYGSALAAAAAWAKIEAMYSLIVAGADLNMAIPGTYGSALAAAAACKTNNANKAVDFLLQRGANANMPLCGKHRFAVGFAWEVKKREGLSSSELKVAREVIKLLFQTVPKELRASLARSLITYCGDGDGDRDRND